MIPTANKAKISHNLSWPIGSEKLSEAFEGLPQISDFTLTFSGYDQNKISTREEIRVMSIEYSYTRPKSEIMVGLGYGSPTWRIGIYPVPRELKYHIKELVDQHLPQLHEWCLSRHSITGNEGREGITVFFDPTTDRLRFDEVSKMSPKVLRRETA